MLRSPTLSVSTNFEYHVYMLLTSGGGRPYSFLNFRCTETGRPPPDVKSIKAWHSKFVDTGSVGDLDRSGRPSVNDETVDAVREAFQCSPGKSTRRA